MKFSQRAGYTPIRNIIQLEQIDDALKNRLWNVLTARCWPELYVGTLPYRNPELHSFLKTLWGQFFKNPIDTMPIDLHSAVQQIRGYFFNEDTPWYNIYDLIEFMAQTLKDNHSFHRICNPQAFMYVCNRVLEEEMSGYRFVNDVISNIISSVEVEEIEESIQQSDRFYGVSTHLKQSLVLLSDRKNPDYRNSIKESISAVESLCKVITENTKASLGDALKLLDKTEVNLHPSLKEAFNKLYGYTSDEKGVRHSLIDKESRVDFDDAKYMLVICSAFCNYLISKQR